MNEPDARNAIIVPEPQEDSETAASPSGRAILLCEDEPLIRMFTADILEDLGFQVFEAGDAASALLILSDNTIDVLVTDVGLPDMSGAMLAQHARALYPDIPVIFVTGEVHVQDLEQDAHTRLIIKPFVAEDLHKAITSLFAPQAPTYT